MTHRFELGASACLNRKPQNTRLLDPAKEVSGIVHCDYVDIAIRDAEVFEIGN